MPESESKSGIDYKIIIKNSNVKDWIQIGGFLIAAQLTIIALIWGGRQITGIYTITILLMISFAFLVNSVFSNSKAHFLAKLIKCEDKVDPDIKEEFAASYRSVERYGYYTFNIAYSFSLIGFTLLAYEYMIVFIGKQIFVVFLPILFMALIWILSVTYTIARSPESLIKELFEVHKILGVLIEIGCLILIIFDFAEVFIIP